MKDEEWCLAYMDRRLASARFRLALVEVYRLIRDACVKAITRPRNCGVASSARGATCSAVDDVAGCD